MKTLVTALILSSLLFAGSICNAAIIMDETHHNGSFSYGPAGSVSAGYWYNTPNALPTGWTEINPYMYTTALKWIQAGSTADAVNNTGEVISAYEAFTVSAALGGGQGVDAWVRVYATQNADGTGDKVLLASVNRLGLSTDGYNLFNVTGAQGTPAASSLVGYYVQVRIGGPYSDFGHYISGNYDNIVVTSEIVPEPATMTILTLGGLLLRRKK
ncbi:MAG: hypothetical protein A2Y12_18845 [Planctomycetes bacterium GWF2_42_9]|nr:MAG: hypothetical protein A2Y12_18845 [Planctomycetes bacterium GWF2_42_9]